MARFRSPISSEDGQAAPEYAGIVLLVASVLGVLLAVAGPVLPGGLLARTLASKLVCAVKAAGPCGEEAIALAAQPSQLQRVYGAEVAAMLSDHSPTIWFEPDDFASLPVDPRECRNRSCADTVNHGSVQRTQTGLEPTVFTHVVDCRDAEAAAAEGFDCSGDRAGNVYLQYWLYFPDSLTHGLGRVGGYHRDDWESYQVRIDPETGEALARASSHRSYNGREGGNIAVDIGEVQRSGWDTVLRQLHVAAGSHAGMSQAGDDDDRRLEPGNVRWVPLEPIVAGGRMPDFEVSPPWEKGVWNDPESTGT